MAKYALSEQAMNERHPLYEKMTRRQNDLYTRPHDVRSSFGRDANRILHSTAYRRLKHKTQVFFNVENDHICTRIEHVAHVDSVSFAIASHLGLNTELTRAISLGHDLGHAPFGHQGESNINTLTQKYLGESFWHEKNGVYMVDKLELLEDSYRQYKNLNLTYATRDGILSHCGEVDENALRPRDPSIGLEEFTTPGAYSPATWEGCVVKLSDKIAYLGRDIEDAIKLKFLCDTEIKELDALAKRFGMDAINTSVIMHNMIMDVCENSNEENGICLGQEYLELINEIKRFNYKHIYDNEKLTPFRKYSNLVIEELFSILADCYDGENTLHKLREKEKTHPLITKEFGKWLAGYVTLDLTSLPYEQTIIERYRNEKIYGNLPDQKTYYRAIIDYLSGMTDAYAIRLFNELLSY
ncbi:MAG: HD domain-containing protein [Clostridia bacterium]|nr:HD domain-containing protein [Clostridia bacterium]